MKNTFFSKPLKILLATNSLILLAGAMLGPIYALFIEDIGGDLLDASLAGAIFALAAGITSLISGKYSDKVKENELIIVLGYAIMGIGFLLFTKVNSMIFLLIVQVLIGFGEAIYSPVFDSIYAKYTDKEKSGRQWAAWYSILYFVTAVGATLGGLIVTKFGFNVMFITMSFLAFGSALYIYLLPRKAL